VSLEDFEHCELIISIGHNPGTNHPRMMGTLHEASRRNVPIIVFNPLRERALERFADPQNFLEMATYGSTRIASTYYQVDGGGDAAALIGIMKALLAMEAAQGDVPAVVLAYGKFIQSVIDFVIVAFAIFMGVKAINRLKREEAVAPSLPPTPTKEEVLLGEIRDLLKAQNDKP